MSNEFDPKAIAQRYETPARIARDFARVASRYPDLAADLLKDLARLLPQSNGSLSAKQRPETLISKVVALFEANENQPLTKEEISKQAGIKPGSLHTLIYQSDSPIVGTVRRKRKMLYRLRSDDYEPLGEGGGL